MLTYIVGNALLDDQQEFYGAGVDRYISFWLQICELC
jgi:hypothetical protein